MKKVNHSDQSAETPDEEVKSESADTGDVPEKPTGTQAESVAETADGSAGETDDSEDSAEDSSCPDSESSDNDPAVELETLRQQLLEAQEGYLRSKAEVDNIRKRTEVEVANARKFALEGFVRDILTVRDSLEMAQAADQHSEGENPSADLSEGLTLILKQLDMVFERFQVEMVEAVRGDKLDPDRHQAMSIEETDDLPPNAITRVVQEGYLLNNRLLRPAMVIVAKTPEKSSEEA